MLTVGLTGGTASGKTEVAKVLRKKGAIIISGDLIGRQVVEKKPQVLKRLTRAFGQEILDPNGKLNRKKLGSIAFSSTKNQKTLNQIVHPYLLRELKAEISKARRSADPRRKHAPDLLVIDAALITEWNLERLLDYTVLVSSSKRLRLKRLREQGLNETEAKNRIARQFNDEVRRKKADFVIENKGSLAELRIKALNLYHTLMVDVLLDKLEKTVREFDRH
jgi:dephospho-CoA kinase